MKISCNLGSPDLPKDHKIYRVLETVSPMMKGSNLKYYWGPECFGLINTPLYTNMSPNDQEKILNMISQSLLEEAYFIEKAGIAFAAKMCLLSETTQEREMYAHFAHQEANHLSMIREFLESDIYETSELLEMFADLIQNGDKQCLTYVIQVLFEGFGLSHYKQLAQNCVDPTLSLAFDLILRDEAQHYRSGMALFDKSGLTEDQTKWISDAEVLFETHIQKGPVHVINALLQVYGKLHLNDYNQLLKDLRVPEQITMGLTVFNRLKEDYGRRRNEPTM